MKLLQTVGMVAAIQSQEPALGPWRERRHHHITSSHGRAIHPIQTENQAVSAEWTARSEVTIRLDHLPPCTTAKHLHRCFKKEGDVEFIEVFETIEGRRNGRGLVRFRSLSASEYFYETSDSNRPPPSKAFWVNRLYQLQIPNQGSFTIACELEPNYRAPFHRSPVNRRFEYQERMVSAMLY